MGTAPGHVFLSKREVEVQIELGDPDGDASTGEDGAESS